MCFLSWVRNGDALGPSATLPQGRSQPPDDTPSEKTRTHSASKSSGSQGGKLGPSEVLSLLHVAFAACKIVTLPSLQSLTPASVPKIASASGVQRLFALLMGEEWAGTGQKTEAVRHIHSSSKYC